jgi:predicted Holliday junction resolvase-like endonuclease
MTIVLGVVIVLLVEQLYRIKRDHHRALESLMTQWQEERRNLYDRIQAPSFAEYKSSEIRTIKATRDEKKEDTPILL